MRAKQKEQQKELIHLGWGPGPSLMPGFRYINKNYCHLEKAEEVPWPLLASLSRLSFIFPYETHINGKNFCSHTDANFGSDLVSFRLLAHIYI